jgi:hypothetical protein
VKRWGLYLIEENRIELGDGSRMGMRWRVENSNFFRKTRWEHPTSLSSGTSSNIFVLFEGCRKLLNIGKRF